VNEKQIYQTGLDQYGASPEALHWVNYRSMAIRFKNLVRDIEVEGRSILDAGCGMGDLLPYLYAKSPDFRYLGVDKKEEFLEIARRRFEGHEFRRGDPFGKKIEMFDVVISSGVMNGHVDNWLEKRKKMITNLFEQTGEVLAFNMAGGINPAPHDSLIAYADAHEIFDFCKTLTPRVILRTEYLPKDFTIVMFKKNYQVE